VSNDTKKLLEQINNISRQLLSRIISVQDELKQDNIFTLNDTSQKMSTKNNDAANKYLPSPINEAKDFVDDVFSALMNQRTLLIKTLFEQKTPEAIAIEAKLLNEMVALDNKISTHAKNCKKALTGQVITLKNRNKVSQTYKKY
jgi:hypothetical protein